MANVDIAEEEAAFELRETHCGVRGKRSPSATVLVGQRRLGVAAFAPTAPAAVTARKPVFIRSVTLRKTPAGRVKRQLLQLISHPLDSCARAL